MNGAENFARDEVEGLFFLKDRGDDVRTKLRVETGYMLLLL